MTPAGARRVLVLNAGSSSIKYAVFEGANRTRAGQVEGLGARPRFVSTDRADGSAQDLPADTRHRDALRVILGALGDGGVAEIAACGHRIVHGGTRFVEPIVVDDSRLDALNAMRALAPLHNGFGLDAIETLRAQAPALRQIACFDTAFHATTPEVATRYALPAELDAEGYRRIGFHGLNFEHVTDTVAKLAPGGLPSRLLIFHLGNGCSACAVRDGRSVATTMGYSTLDGLVMGTRCGAIDPGVLLSLQRDRGVTLTEVEDLLYRRSGLLALSGHSADMRVLERHVDAASRFAIEHFCYWAARHAGSLAVALGGVDAIAFSGGIGCGSADVRAQIVGHLGWLGFEIDETRNRGRDGPLASERSRGPIWAIEANEELAIARHVQRVLDARG